MQLHNLTRSTPKLEKKRIGRGGKRGKTSGKGGKGQTARAGSRPRPEMRDIIKRLPKLRGFGKNRARTVNTERVVPIAVNVGDLGAYFKAGSTVTPATLVAAGAVARRGGKVPPVKILGTGELAVALTIGQCAVSASARTKIEAAGGSVAA
jgi:large subunit ribosomal protein L15